MIRPGPEAPSSRRAAAGLWVTGWGAQLALEPPHRRRVHSLLRGLQVRPRLSDVTLSPCAAVRVTRRCPRTASCRSEDSCRRAARRPRALPRGLRTPCSAPARVEVGDDSSLTDRRQQTGGTSLPSLVTQERNFHLASEHPYCPLNSHI